MSGLRRRAGIVTGVSVSLSDEAEEEETMTTRLISEKTGLNRTGLNTELKED